MMRRRLLLGAGVACVAPALWAQPDEGEEPGIFVPASRLQDMLGHAFPHTRELAHVAQLRLWAPRLRLLPELNRLQTGLQLSVTQEAAQARLTGTLLASHRLRFDPRQGAIRAHDLHLERLQLDQVEARHGPLLQRYAALAARQLLDDMVLYRIPRRQLDLLDNLGLTIAALQVHKNGVQVQLAPGALTDQPQAQKS